MAFQTKSQRNNFRHLPSNHLIVLFHDSCFYSAFFIEKVTNDALRKVEASLKYELGKDWSLLTIDPDTKKKDPAGLKLKIDITKFVSQISGMVCAITCQHRGWPSLGIPLQAGIARFRMCVQEMLRVQSRLKLSGHFIENLTFRRPRSDRISWRYRVSRK